MPTNEPKLMPVLSLLWCHPTSPQHLVQQESSWEHRCVLDQHHAARWEGDSRYRRQQRVCIFQGYYHGGHRTRYSGCFSNQVMDYLPFNSWSRQYYMRAEVGRRGFCSRTRVCADRTDACCVIRCHEVGVWTSFSHSHTHTLQHIMLHVSLFIMYYSMNQLYECCDGEAVLVQVHMQNIEPISIIFGPTCQNRASSRARGTGGRVLAGRRWVWWALDFPSVCFMGRMDQW